ncbi:hypothetical protein ES703_54612 [subsurface metagenome]
MNDNQYQLPNQRGLLKPTLQITFFSILGTFIIFVTQIIVAAKFGANQETEVNIGRSRLIYTVGSIPLR